MSLKKVALVGGTHGNERIGVELIHQWQRGAQPHDLPFELQLVLANPQAVALNRRYIDEDLNRSFRPEDLRNLSLSSYEAQRAKVLAHQLAGTDFLIDLHNTTAQMGLTLILSQPEALTDPLTLQLCAHLATQDPGVRIYFMPQPAGNSPYLPSLARHDLTLEVGPLMHGTLEADLYFRTNRLVWSALEFLAAWENKEVLPGSGQLEVFQHLENLDYPRTSSGHLNGMLHPSLKGQDFQPLQPGDPLFVTFANQTLYYEGPETVWPVFINEQAYYEKKLALSLTQRMELTF
jgi:aspartoacylase